MTTSHEGHELVRRYVERIWVEGDIDALPELLAPTYRRHLSPRDEPLTLDGQRQRLAGIRAAFPDATLTVESVIAEGDLVAFRSILRGTHRGPFLGLPPTGRRFEVSIVDVLRVAHGMVVEHWGGPDMLDLVRQLGATLTPAVSDSVVAAAPPPVELDL
jgi:steroid delta-isomerase-like uncharacterized protein